MLGTLSSYALEGLEAVPVDVVVDEEWATVDRRLRTDSGDCFRRSLLLVQQDD